MTVLSDLHAWAEQQFGQAELGNARRTQRLVRSAAAIATHPEASFTEIFEWNGLRGFYRLCDQSEATLEAVQKPHWQLTRQAMTQAPVVLILHDTTYLDFTAHPALKDIGPIGDGNGRGILQHNSLAVVPKPRQVLGLAFQQLWIRDPEHPRESTYQRKRSSEPAESSLWPTSIRSIGPAPESSCWVDVADRGGDDYEAMLAARELGHHFLFRVRENRKVFTSSEHDREGYLLDFARSLPAQAHDKVRIPQRGGRAKRARRTAKIALAAAPVWIPAPHDVPQRKSKPILEAWVIRIWEPNPPAGVEPLEWVLICSVPTRTAEEMLERRDWYSCRWMIEVYHDIEKNGCSEEDRRFTTAGRMETCLAILAVVAVRVYQLRCAMEAQPEAPAEQIATATEIRVLRRWLHETKRRLTVFEFVVGVAKLGGFLGRTGDGTPGVRVLWRGYERLQDLVLGYQLNASATKRDRVRSW